MLFLTIWVSCCLSHIRKIQLVVYCQCCVLIGWATTKFSVAILQLSFRKQFWIALFAGAENEQRVDNFNFRTEDLLTDLFTVKEDFGRGITTISEARILQNATTFEPRFTYTRLILTPCYYGDFLWPLRVPINGVFGMTGLTGTPYLKPNSGIFKTLCNFELSFLLNNVA